MTSFARTAVPYGFATTVVASVLALVVLDFMQTPLASTKEEVSDGLQTAREAAKESMEEVKRAEPNPDHDGVDKRVEYTHSVFVKIPFGMDGFEIVTVGMEFADSNASKPRDQWCYVTKSTGVEATKRQITLAVKSDGERVDIPITEDMANEGGTSVEVIQAAQKLCRFM